MPVALLLASSSLDMRLLSAGMVSCVPDTAGVSLCFNMIQNDAYAINAGSSCAAAIKQHSTGTVALLIGTTNKRRS